MLSEAENKNEEEYYDLTAKINENSIVYPGDPTYKAEKVYSLDKNSNYNLSCLQFGNHQGTHVDFPSHVLKDGKKNEDFSINQLIGEGVIIEVPDKFNSITKEFIEQQHIKKNDFVFFKTANSKLKKFSNEYVYIEPAAAQELLNKEVKIVGIDYISVDKYEFEDLPVHKSLLSNNVLIVEGLELNNAPIGRCKIFIAPLNIPDLDGTPARVFCKKL